MADIEEGIELREAGDRGRILVFGALSVSDVAGVFSHDLTPTVSSPAPRRRWAPPAAPAAPDCAATSRSTPASTASASVTTTCGRTLAAECSATPALEIEAVYTHFATADEPEHDAVRDPAATVRRGADHVIAGSARRRALVHAANSAACLRDSRTWGDSVRPGLLLYGVVPPPLAATLPLAPAMTLSSRVVAVKGARIGEAVGYGARHVAAAPQTLAVVPAGYADGLDRRLEGRGAVLVRGRRAPIVGAVSMDMLTVDVTGIDGVSTGDEVVLLGSQGSESWQTIDAREMAAWIGTIPYEVLCRLGARVTRRYDS